MSDDDDRQFDPTPRKLEEARRRGEVVRSAELTTAATFAALLVALKTAGPAMLDRFGTAATKLFEGGPATGAAAAVTLAILPLFLLPALGAMAALAAQRALVIAPDRLHAKLSRISPLANAGHKFGRTGLAEFLKAVVKLVLVGAVLGTYLAAQGPALIASLGLPSRGGITEIFRVLTDILGLILAINLAIGALDYLWQRHEFLRRNRMTRQEMMDEHKESEGDPHMRAQRRQKAQEIALAPMLADVARADVVIVNPTHYAVALRWDRTRGRAPVCVAKGTDEIAARIRERAALAGVPVRSDPPTARALHAALAVGDEVRPEHYAPVAAAIRFAERMRARARERSGG